MSLVHDIIKIQYVNLGYLPDYPPHLISDEEMFRAFLSEDGQSGFFVDEYPNMDPDFVIEDTTFGAVYDELVDNLQHYIQQNLDTGEVIPDWVYSFMLGSVVGPQSDERDIQNLANLLKIDDSEFTTEFSRKCYRISKNWLPKSPYEAWQHRVPAIFGEPHVIKACRVQAEVI